MADTGPCKRSSPTGEGTETLAYGKAVAAIRDQPPRSHCRHRVLSAADSGAVRSMRLRGPRCSRSDLTIGNRRSPNRIHDEARPQLSLAARAAGNGDPKPASSPRSGIGRDRERQAHPGRGSDRNRTDQRKRSLPQLCRYAELRETKGCVITRHGGRHGEHECDSGADQWQAERRDRNLARREGEGSGNQADKESADLTSAAVVGGNTCGNGNEDGQGMDRKRKCGAPKNVAHTRQTFLWSREAGSLRHIFARG